MTVCRGKSAFCILHTSRPSINCVKTLASIKWWSCYLHQWRLCVATVVSASPLECLPTLGAGAERKKERENKLTLSHHVVQWEQLWMTRQTEEEVGRQHQGMDRPGIPQVPEGSGEQGKMEKTGCEIICGAQTTLAVKGLLLLLMMMMMMIMMNWGW